MQKSFLKRLFKSLNCLMVVMSLVFSSVQLSNAAPDDALVNMGKGLAEDAGVFQGLTGVAAGAVACGVGVMTRQIVPPIMIIAAYFIGDKMFDYGTSKLDKMGKGS